MGGMRAAGRVFISYAHDDERHIAQVGQFHEFLVGRGVAADLDVPASERRQDWALWMLRGIRDSRHVIVVASPEYKRRAEGDARPGEGLGVQWEARLLRNLVYADAEAALERIVPVVLPGRSAGELPLWLSPYTDTVVSVDKFTEDGADELLGLLGLLKGRPKPAAPRVSPAAAFVMPDRKELVGALLDVPALHRSGTRHELLEVMGQSLGLPRRFEVPESDDARTHLRALDSRIRRTTHLADAACTAMYVALDEIVPDDTGVEKVRALLVRCGLVLPEK